MRLLFLFLLLVNGLIYLWYTVNSVPVQAIAVNTEPDAPKLVLLTEEHQLPEVDAGSQSRGNDQTQVDTSSADTDNSKPISSKTYCYTLGPFMNEDSVSEASTGLAGSGRPFEKRVSEKKELIGYWVMIPPLKNEDEARAKVQELKLLGDKHHYIVREPAEEKWAISLGVFHSRKNAEGRLSRMKNLGYNVKLEGRYRQNPVYWLDYTELDKQAQIDITQFVGAQRLPRSCETIASTQTIP